MNFLENSGLGKNLMDIILDKISNGDLDINTVVELVKYSITDKNLQQILKTFNATELETLVKNHPECIRILAAVAEGEQPSWIDAKNCIFAVRKEITRRFYFQY
jgi:hypothetical protein